MTILFLTTDLMISSQASGAAGRCEVELIHLQSAEAVLEQLKSGSADLIVIDVETRGIELASLVTQIRQHSPAPRVLAFGPHVHEAQQAAARDAGCDQVLTRGQFHSGMDTIFSSLD
jgi:DNA-binding response OmpR family regulator